MRFVGQRLITKVCRRGSPSLRNPTAVTAGRYSVRHKRPRKPRDLVVNGFHVQGHFVGTH